MVVCLVNRSGQHGEAQSFKIADSGANSKAGRATNSLELSGLGSDESQRLEQLQHRGEKG